MGNREKHKKFELDLFGFLQKGYPAAIASANAARLSQLVSPVAGPYTIATGETFRWAVNVGALHIEKEVSLTAGSRTATQLAATINAHASPGVTAAADSDGRLTITSDTAPTAATHSDVIILEPGVGTAHVTLGWWVGAKDTRALLKTPRFVSGPGNHRSIPEVELTMVSSEPDEPRQSGMDTYSARLTVRDYDALGDSQATYDLVRHHHAIIDDLIAADPSAGGKFTNCEVTRMQAEPDVWEVNLAEFNQNLTFGEGVLEIEARVYNY
jgi:hypothetical protein